jgi:hypothetical protein
MDDKDQIIRNLAMTVRRLVRRISVRYGNPDDPVAMLSMKYLHEQGLEGEGILREEK